MKTFVAFTALATVSTLAACAPLHPELVSDSQLVAQGTGTPVVASAETQAVATRNLDSADDPEVWVNPRNSSEVLIFATDKKAGLYAYDLDGKVVDFLPYGPLNNVDLRTPDGDLLIGATDRANNGVALMRLTPARKIEKLAFLPLPTSEAYGFCMGSLQLAASKPVTVVAIVGKNGDVAMAQLNDVGQYSLHDEKRFAVGSQSEGCVIDDRTGRFYVAEENTGIWQYDLNDWSRAGQMRKALAAAPSDMLKPDVEGLTLLREGDSTYLIASSQGDSAFAIWRVEGDAAVYQGRFSVIAGNGIDAVTGTDGVAALGGQVGPYSHGVVVMQDDSDTDGEAPATTRVRQNFKVVDWLKIKDALKLQ